MTRRTALLVLAAAAAACGHRPPRPAAPLVTLRPLAPIAKLAPLPFIPGYEVFRDSSSAVWGDRMRLGASWRVGLPEGAALTGVAAVAAEGALLAHTVTDGWNDAMRRLDPSGKEVSVSALPRYIRGLDILGRGPGAALLAHEMYRVQVLSWDGRPLWATEKTGAQYAVGDVDGDRQEDLVTSGGYSGEVAAHSLAGKPLWTRSGVGHISDVAAGRFLPGPADSVAVLTTRPDHAGVTLLGPDGKERAFLQDACAPEAAAALRRPGRTSVLALLCSGNRAERLRLKVVEASEQGLRVVAESVLGWAESSALRAADLDGDGADELVVGTTAGWVLVYSGTAEWLSERHWFGAITALAAADVDSDGKDELIVGVSGQEPATYLVEVVPDPAPQAVPVREGR